MFYVMTADTDTEGHILRLSYKKDHRGRSWLEGKAFSSDPNEPRPFNRVPPLPIRVEIVESSRQAPLPSFDETPIPLLSSELLRVLRQAGVDNLDTYPVELYFEDGRLASTKYVAFNLIGLVAAADLNASIFAVDQTSRMFDMQIDQLVLNESVCANLRMFRLAENVSTILVHAEVKAAIEQAGIPLLRFFGTDEVALL